MSTGRPRTFFHCHPVGEDPGVRAGVEGKVVVGLAGEISDDCEEDQ